MGFVEGPVGRGLVADEECEVLGNWVVDALHVKAEGAGLEADGAKAEPLIVGHLFDEDLLDVGGGLEFSHEVGVEAVEVVRIFFVEEEGGGSEAVGDGV